MASDSVSIATDLMVALNATAYRSKIKYLLPLLGSNLAAVRVPLIDVLGVGPVANTGFVDADFSQATGLQGGSGKRLTAPFKASDIGTGNNGGIGFWDTNVSISETSYLCGALETDGTQYNFYFASGLTFFGWGSGAGTDASVAVTPTNGHFYGQSSSTTSRELFKDGALLVSDTDTATRTMVEDKFIVIMGDSFSGGRSYLGRFACVYFTDGQLTSGEVASLNSLLQSYLITPTGR